MMSFNKSFATVVFVLVFLCSIGEDVEAIELNLGEFCSGERVHHCALANISGNYVDAVQLTNASVPLLKELVLRDSIIVRIPGEIFEQAPNLESFFVYNCRLHRLNGNEFQLGGKLKVVGLQNNHFYDVPASLFSECGALEELHLVHDTIHVIHRSSFDRLSLLRHLDLQSNSLKDLPDGLFDGLISLEHIDLSSNLISKIDSNTFAKNSRLQTMLLSDNKFSVFEPNAIEHLTRLSLLDVSSNKIDELYLQSVDTLVAQNSGLQRCVISGGVRKARIGNSQLRNLTITDKLSVHELELHGNELESLDPFEGMLNLQRLDVSKNYLKSLNTLQSPMVLHLPSLTHFNVGFNQLQNLTFEHFLQLAKLTHLDISFNRLLRLDQRILEPLWNLEKLYIEGNHLHAFDYEQFTRSHVHLKEIGIFDNEWEYRYMRKMMAFFKEQDILLPVRFKSNIEEHELKENSTVTATTKALHHHYASTVKADPLETNEVSRQHELRGVTGIHPYWTTRDILAVATLVMVFIILLMLLYRILQEEGCLAACWHRGRSVMTRVHRRHLDEEDSEV